MKSKQLLERLSNKLTLLLLLVPFWGLSQNWMLVDILSQSNKELVYRIDDGKKLKKKRVKNPSVVALIASIEDKGFSLEAITQGVELELNGMLPVGTLSQRNFGTTQLNLDNNNRILLWFKKRE
ncbi:MAG: hypothetical protein ACPGO4_01900 [Flavobacteriaceae bacterium]|jgi:hypothetical protein